MWATEEESINTGQGCGDVVWKADLYSGRVQGGDSSSGSSRPMQSLKPDVLHPRMLRKLTDTSLRLFSHLWKVIESTGSPQQWEANTAPICLKGDLGKPGVLGSTALPGKIMEQPLLECGFGYVKEKWGTGKSQHGFANAKLCLSSLSDFCD